jgi:hypothetical protein
MGQVPTWLCGSSLSLGHLGSSLLTLCGPFEGNLVGLLATVPQANLAGHLSAKLRPSLLRASFLARAGQEGSYLSTWWPLDHFTRFFLCLCPL